MSYCFALESAMFAAAAAVWVEGNILVASSSVEQQLSWRRVELVTQIIYIYIYIYIYGYIASQSTMLIAYTEAMHVAI